MSLLSHEVGHLKHIEESGNPIKYIGSFILDYISNFGHDDVPREKKQKKDVWCLMPFISLLIEHMKVKLPWRIFLSQIKVTRPK